MTPTLVVRCDASARVGLGHLLRCLVLADAWAAVGGRAIFAMHGPAMVGRDRIVGSGHVIEPIVSHDSAAELLALAARSNAQLVAIDHYDLGENYLLELRRGGVRTLAIDDICAHAFPVDVLLNQNTDAFELPYVTSPHTVRLFGPEYALVRDSYRRARSSKFKGLGTTTLITFGGSDPEDRTTFAVRALGHIRRRLSIVVVVGAAYQGVVDEAAAHSSHDIVIHRDLSDLVGPMREAMLMIGAGGSTVWEACCLGVPMVLVPFADNQRGIVASLAKLGAARDASGLSDAELAALVDSLSPESLTTMAGVAWQLVDGEGAIRIVEAIR